MSNRVNHPQHYQGANGIECIDIIRHYVCDIDFNRAASENVTLQDTNLPAQFAIGLKNSSLMSMLQVAAKTENVVISLADAARAILIRPEDCKDSTTALCMPMLLNDK